VQQSFPFASHRRPVEDLSDSERDLGALDTELSAIALRAAERGLSLSSAGTTVPDLDSYRMEAVKLSADQNQVLSRAARRARRLSGAASSRMAVPSSLSSMTHKAVRPNSSHPFHPSKSRE